MSLAQGTPEVLAQDDLGRNGHQSLCHRSGEPIYITKKGQGDLVVLSLAAYERDQARLQLYRLLDEAEADRAAGDTGSTLAAVARRLRK